MPAGEYEVMTIREIDGVQVEGKTVVRGTCLDGHLRAEMLNPGQLLVLACRQLDGVR